jgi:hypothetical protein
MSSNHFALVEGRFVPISEEEVASQGTNNRSLRPSSPDFGYLDMGQSCSLCEALKDSSDFYFDMSDRWKNALCSSLDDPIYPIETEEPDQSSSPFFGLGRLFIRRTDSK